MGTANARTDVAVVGGGMAGLLTAACYPAGSGANAALFGRAPHLGGRAATRNVRTGRTDRGSA
jgi:phytoene dehydrogenase-like protein